MVLTTRWTFNDVLWVCHVDISISTTKSWCGRWSSLEALTTEQAASWSIFARLKMLSKQVRRVGLPGELKQLELAPAQALLHP